MFDDNLCSRGCFLVLFIGLFSSVSFNQMHVKRDTRAAAAALFVGGRRDNHSDRVCGRVPQAEQGVHRGGHPPPPHHQGLQESHQTGKQHSTAHATPSLTFYYTKVVSSSLSSTISSDHVSYFSPKRPQGGNKTEGSNTIQQGVFITECFITTSVYNDHFPSSCHTANACNDYLYNDGFYTDIKINCPSGSL